MLATTVFHVNDKKIAQKVWSKNLVYEKTFRLSIHTTWVLFNVFSKTNTCINRMDKKKS